MQTLTSSAAQLARDIKLANAGQSRKTTLQEKQPAFMMQLELRPFRYVITLTFSMTYSTESCRRCEVMTCGSVSCHSQEQACLWRCVIAS